MDSALNSHAILRQGGRSPSGYHKRCNHSREKETCYLKGRNSRQICSYMIEIVSITNLSLYDVLLKVFGLIWDPEHCHGKGKIQHHLLKNKDTLTSQFQNCYITTQPIVAKYTKPKTMYTCLRRKAKKQQQTNCFKITVLTLNTSNLTPIFTSAYGNEITVDVKLQPFLISCYIANTSTLYSQRPSHYFRVSKRSNRFKPAAHALKL